MVWKMKISKNSARARVKLDSIKKKEKLIEKPNIILIVMDAVRYDHLSCYDYEKETTPNIDELSDKGILFMNAFSTSAWTPPSLASIFTGKYPSHHQVINPNLYLHEHNVIITEILQTQGYKTFGANIPVQINSLRGYNKGWDIFWEPYRDRFFKKIPYFFKFFFENLIKEHWKNIFFNKHIFDELKYNFQSYLTINIVKKWIKKLDKKTPFFLYMHFLEAHSPYYPLQRFKIKFEKQIFSILDMKKIRFIADKGRWDYIAKEIELFENEFDLLKSWYDAEISYIDYRLKNFFEFLEIEDLEDNTIIIITADHGENFGEHHLMDHQYCLYDTLLHVPLIIYNPRLRARKIFNIVSLVDIFPTILNLAGLKINNEKYNIDGISLASFVDKKYHDYIYGEYGKPNIEIYKKLYPKYDYSIINIEKKCIRSQKYKYIISSNGIEELYNLLEDPFEKKNLIEKYPKISKKMKEKIYKTLGYFKEKEINIKDIKEDEIIIKRLRDLGYIS